MLYGLTQTTRTRANMHYHGPSNLVIQASFHLNLAKAEAEQQGVITVAKL